MTIEVTPQHRARLREMGYSDGRAGRPKRHDHPEYLTSYRRGVEAKAREEVVRASQS
jgi:hypothetical protein